MKLTKRVWPLELSGFEPEEPGSEHQMYMTFHTNKPLEGKDWQKPMASAITDTGIYILKNNGF